MPIQSNNINLSEAFMFAGGVKKTREDHKRMMQALKVELAHHTKEAVYANRTDVVLTSEILGALRDVFAAAGFSTNRKELERYL